MAMQKVRNDGNTEKWRKFCPAKVGAKCTASGLCIQYSTIGATKVGVHSSIVHTFENYFTYKLGNWEHSYAATLPEMTIKTSEQLHQRMRLQCESDGAHRPSERFRNQQAETAEHYLEPI